MSLFQYFNISIFQYFVSIEDHRVDDNKDYELAGIIFLTIAVVLCGAKGWKAVKVFGEAQLDWLREYRNFSKGIPPIHSIERIIRGIKTESLVSSFINFSNTVRENEGKEHISFDGKVLCRSKHGDIDTMLCQTETASLIRQGQGDYVLQVKKNQSNLYKEIEAYFHKTYRNSPELLTDNTFKELGGEHGRINKREYRLLPITNGFDETDKFEDSFAVLKVQRTREFKHKTEQETSYFITSLKDKVEVTVRRKWLDLIKAHPLKDRVAGKMQRACWDANFRAEILFGQKSTKA